jgi:hypothetical protein
MGLLSFLARTKSVDIPARGPFLMGHGGAPVKSREFLRSDTRWVSACTSAIVDEIATIEFRR